MSDSFLAKVAARFSRKLSNDSSKATDAPSNPKLDVPKSDGRILVEGIVVRSGVHTYDYEVALANSDTITCVALSASALAITGANDSILIPEGSRVLVYIVSHEDKFGIIIGSIPEYVYDADVTGIPALRRATGYETGAGQASSIAYRLPIINEKHLKKVHAQAGRPGDVIPGEFANVNENQVGLMINALSTTLKATGRAQLTASVIDDMVRVVSGLYQHHSSLGTSAIYNDGGYITHEIGVSPYHHERLGMLTPGKDITKFGPKNTAKLKHKSTCIVKKEKGLTSRPRLRAFIGYLGDIVSLFISTPNKDIEEFTENTNIIEQGTFHANIDGSGKFMATSAGGFSLRRYDKIAVPIRKLQPWDPKGDRVEDGDSIAEKVKESFKSPAGQEASLRTRDALAWDRARANWRFGASGTESKDIYLPNEIEIPDLDDNYDDYGKAKSQASKHINRESIFHMADDGSIIIRDAWGSEINMGYGDITLTCPGRLYLRPGQDVVSLAGRDTIIKAKNSIDITATDKDIRLKAEKNLQATGEGVIIESLAKSIAPWSNKGELTQGSGVAIIAKKSNVILSGKDTYISANDNIKVTTTSEGDNGNGSVVISSGKFNVTTEHNSVIAVGESDGLYITKSQVTLAGKSVILAGSSGVAITKGEQMAAIMFIGTGTNVYETIAPQFSSIRDVVVNEGWYGPILPANLEYCEFTYRNEDEYKIENIVSHDDTISFKLYQPPWARLKSSGQSLLKTGALSAWSEKDRDGTYPWPGNPNGKYAKLSSELNVTSEGKAKAWITLENDGTSGVEVVSLDQYEIIK